MDFLRVNWEGRIPARISLDLEEARSFLHVPKEKLDNLSSKDLFMFLPRCSYLPLLVIEMRSYFSRIVGIDFDGKEGDIWFEFDKEPLRWEYPIGLLYDIAHASSTEKENSAPDEPQGVAKVDKAEQLSLPWHITIRFNNFPSKVLLSLKNGGIHDEVRGRFISQLKASDSLRNGNIKTIMDLTKQEQTSMWDGLLTQNYEKFWNVNMKIINPSSLEGLDVSELHKEITYRKSENIEGKGSDFTEVKLPKNIPLILYIGKPLSEKILRPIPPMKFDQNGRALDVTIGEAVLMTLSKAWGVGNTGVEDEELYGTDEVLNYSLNKDSINNNKNIDKRKYGLIDEQIMHYFSKIEGNLLENLEIIAHGVTLDHDTPLLWLNRNFSYPDNFLHVVIKIKSQ